MTFRLSAAAFAVSAAATLPAAAQTAADAPVFSTQSSAPVIFTLRGGVGTAPEYFGSDDYTLVPDIGFSARYLRFGRFEFGDPDPWAIDNGFGFYPSFGLVGARDADDFDDLDGLDDIDAAIEVGLGARYNTQNFRAFGEVRRGFGGHEGTVGELGADFIASPTDRLRLTAGPRFTWGNAEYTDTYFGIDADEAARSANFDAYEAEDGLVSSGVEFGMRYVIDDNWAVEGAITYDRFRGDAEDSPIVRDGSDDQWGARIGVTRVFRIGG